MSLTTAASAATGGGNNGFIISRIQSLVEEKISAVDSNITINKSKILHDFSGNEYELIECNPTGYFIIHPKSGIIVEYSTSSQSPYKDYNSSLYYGGPSYYYVKSGDSYTHTVLGTTVADVDAAALTCNKTENELMSHANSNVVNYLEGKTASLSKDSSLFAAAATDYMVKDPAWFSNLNSGFGYVGGGYCGYVASNLVLKYWFYHSTIYFSYPYHVVNDTSLTNKLISIGGSADTWAQPICSTINTFCSQQGMPQDGSWYIGVIGAVSELQNNRRPVILFGNLQSAGNHAVVAYGVNAYENPGYYTFICHYGWSDVHICGLNSVFGSNAEYLLPASYQF